MGRGRRGCEGGVTVRNEREHMSGRGRGCEEWEGGVRVRNGKEDTSGRGCEEWEGGVRVHVGMIRVGRGRRSDGKE